MTKELSENIKLAKERDAELEHGYLEQARSVINYCEKAGFNQKDLTCRALAVILEKLGTEEIKEILDALINDMKNRERIKTEKELAGLRD